MSKLKCSVKFLITLLLVVSFARNGILSASDAVENADEFEGKLKAAFIAKVPYYIDFPVPVSEELVIATVSVLKEEKPCLVSKFLIQQAEDGKRKIICRDFEDKELDLAKVNILIVRGSDKALIQKALDSVKGLPVLTVGMDEHFAENGGMIAVYTHRNHLRFDVNMGVMESSNLKMRASMIRLARNVIR